ncbi:MAG TPA: family 16 glycoside hydrolase [Pirellulales bacterium]|nr:family 16 glycoside hydrolase [Pirellulales bacterium]
MDPLARTSPCPSRENLTSLGLGTLSAEAWQTVADHVQTCEACSSLIESLSDVGDDLVGWLRELKGSAEPISVEAGDIAGIEFGAPAAGKPRAPTLPPGTRFREYQILERIGEGGMGIVYRALHTRLERLVALKVLGDGRMHKPEALARFRREMKAVGKINHPNVVQATDAGETDGTHFLVMELVEGIDAARLLQKRGPQAIADACEMIRQASLGLASIHQHGLIHRDIKASNLILARGGTVKILDLGLALLQNPMQVREATTSAGLMLGSFDYMAPEQADDPHAVDGRADLYSLGCTLFQLLTAQTPFPASHYKTPLQKLKAHESEIPPAVDKLRDDVPRELAQIVARLLAKKPEKRFASAEELAAALQPFAAGSNLPLLAVQSFDSPTSGHHDPLEYPHDVPPKVTGRTTGSTNRAGRWLKGIAAVTVLAGVLFALLIYPRPTNEPRPTHEPAVEAETGWATLFNGKDLTGWKTLPGDPNSWSVDRGILVGQGPAPSNLYSQRGDFRDFHLRAEANMTAAEDSGIFFRVPFERLKGPIPYEAQILGEHQEDYNTGGLWGFADGRVTDMLVEPGEWFTLEIIAEGNHLVLKVNGQTTVDYTDADDSFASGHIALQHFKEKGVVRFRKVEIKDLPTSAPVPAAGLRGRETPLADLAGAGNRT